MVVSVGSPAVVISGGRPAVVVSGGRPAVVVSGGRPAVVVSGGRPAVVVSGGRPAVVVSGGSPAIVVSGGRPAVVVSGGRPAVAPGNCRIAVLASDGRPAVSPSRGRCHQTVSPNEGFPATATKGDLAAVIPSPAVVAVHGWAGLESAPSVAGCWRQLAVTRTKMSSTSHRLKSLQILAFIDTKNKTLSSVVFASGKVLRLRILCSFCQCQRNILLLRLFSRAADRFIGGGRDRQYCTQYI